MLSAETRPAGSAGRGQEQYRGGVKQGNGGSIPNPELLQCLNQQPAPVFRDKPAPAVPDPAPAPVRTFSSCAHGISSVSAITEGAFSSTRPIKGSISEAAWSAACRGLSSGSMGMAEAAEGEETEAPRSDALPMCATPPVAGPPPSDTDCAGAGALSKAAEGDGAAWSAGGPPGPDPRSRPSKRRRLRVAPHRCNRCSSV